MTSTEDAHSGTEGSGGFGAGRFGGRFFGDPERFADRFRGREGFEGRFGDCERLDRCQARGQIYSEFACGCARAHVDESGVEAASRNARLTCRRLLTVSASSRSRRYKRVSVGGT